MLSHLDISHKNRAWITLAAWFCKIVFFLKTYNFRKIECYSIVLVHASVAWCSLSVRSSQFSYDVASNNKRSISLPCLSFVEVTWRQLVRKETAPKLMKQIHCRTQETRCYCAREKTSGKRLNLDSANRYQESTDKIRRDERK